jgi:hypothetical protein
MQQAQGMRRKAMSKLAFIIASLFGIMTECSAQSSDSIAVITRRYYEGSLRFEFTHSRRLDDGHVTIDLYRNDWSDSADVMVRVITAHGTKRSGNWESDRDSIFFTGVEVFNRLFGQAMDLDATFIGKSLDPNGADGTTFTIKFGGGMSSVTYKVWTPDYDTDERGLAPFLDLCKKFLELGGLDPWRFIDR